MSFNTFNFHPNILSAIQQCGYTKPTPIQQHAITPILEKKDLLGLAQTGTGKTAAFVLPMVQNLLDGPSGKIRALVITPTRELAEQIVDYAKTITGNTSLRCLAVYGGVSKTAQKIKLKEGVDIIVACPGRLLDHMNDRSVDLSFVEMLVLDEADHMFDQGFLPDIRRILRSVNSRRQTLVFSATMPSEVRHLVEKILTNPVTVQVDEIRPAKGIVHGVYHIEQNGKTDLLKGILDQQDVQTALVFTRTKHRAKNLALQLQRSNFNAVALQGNMSQTKRQSALDGFKNGTFRILVATDIAARGIDVTKISHVINYDVPDTVQAYTHRTGRTGRAECSGTAFSFVTAEDNRIIRMIEQNLGSRIEKLKSPSPAGTKVVRSIEHVQDVPRAACGNIVGKEQRIKRNQGGKSRRSRSVPFDFGI